MQKNLSDDASSKKQSKFLKYLLVSFVVVSVATMIYKAYSSTNSTKLEPKTDVTVIKEESASKADLASSKLKAKKAEASQKRAIVYYFYTSARCYSCKLLESYTKETVEKRFANPYKGWSIEFKGVNVELPENNHFIQDYWLNSKSVVVQKFEGEKPLNWAILKDVWQLLGNKSAFMNYVTNEIEKMLEEK